MLNRNATRHLLFAVSILLCFFIYMGYRFLGSDESGSAVAPYPPFDENVATPPGSAPTDVSVPIDDGDSSWVSSAPSAPSPDSGGSSPSLAPPLSMPPPASSGPVSSTSHSGAITGLIPAPPSDTPATSASDDNGASFPSLPLPTGAGDADSASSGDLRPFMDGDDEGGEEIEDLASYASAPSARTYMPPPAGMPAASPVSPPAPAGGISTVSPSAPTSVAVAPPPAAMPVPAPAVASVSVPPPSGVRPPSATPSVSSPPASPPSVPPSPAPVGAASPPVRPDGASPYGPYQDLPESLRIYVVLPGDTLSSIAARELGSASLAENIFLLNRDAIEDPDHLMAGVRIRLPVREAAAAAAEPAPPDTAGRRPAMGLGRSHIVARGDTLSSISMQYYGTSAGWRFLYEANKAVVSNPNTLTVGMELSIPPYEQ